MNGRMQSFCATCLAALLHLAMFATWPVLQGAESAGAGGEARLSIHADNAELAALVAAWETPPEVSVTPSMMPPPDSAGHRTLPVPQQTDATVMPPPLAPRLALPGLTPPPPDTVPLADSSPPPAPPLPAQLTLWQSPLMLRKHRQRHGQRHAPIGPHLPQIRPPPMRAIWRPRRQHRPPNRPQAAAMQSEPDRRVPTIRQPAPRPGKPI